jgi:ribosomal protein L7/L12
MPQIDCPNCGAPVDSGERACPYCGTAIKAAGASLMPQNQLDSDLFSGKIGLNPNDAGQFRAVRELIERGNKIEAIKVYREITGVGLKEAKDAVDAMTAGQPIVVSQATLVSGSALAGAGFASSAALMDEIKRLLRSGNKIEAIKIYREYFNVGLKDAKDAVDAAETELKFQSAPGLEDNVPSFARPEVLPVEPTMGANPFDESQKPSGVRKWLIGCSLAALIFLCFCVALPVVLIFVWAIGNGN